MSKSLGNLVFVDKLRTEWDPMAIRLGAHRAPLPHRVGVGRRVDAAQRRAARGGGVTAPTATASDLLDEVRERLDDDLDTPGAVAADRRRRRAWRVDAGRRRTCWACNSQPAG